jgi:hypothetical protein
VIRKKLKSKDPDIISSMSALRRAAKHALQIGIDTGTPVYVLKHGQIVDLTVRHKSHKKKK